MSVKDAAREVVAAWARYYPENGEDRALRVAIIAPHVETLQRELALDGDREALAKEMHARRQSDTVENAKAFKAKFHELLQAHEFVIIDATAGKLGPIHGDTFAPSLDALCNHLFGAMDK